MTDLHGFPYAELQFRKGGEIVDRNGFDQWRDRLATGSVRDAFVLAHGWNNHLGEARALYDGLARRLREVSEAPPPPGLRADGGFAILGVFWPSKRWAERALIPGGAAGTGGDADDAELQQRLAELRGVFDAPDADQRLVAASELVSELEDDPSARDRFVDLVRDLAPDAAIEDSDDVAVEYADLDGHELLDRLTAPVRATPPGDPGGAASFFDNRCEPDEAEAGGAAGLSVAGVRAAAERLLNLTTYYQMKARAGLVGAHGLAPVLCELRQVRPDLRLHLVGHSFGGRLMAAATLGEPGRPSVEPDSLTLLQAAFSHFGFSPSYDDDGHAGFFRPVIDGKMTRGPILITHSVCDQAVGYAYPLASRLANQVAAGLGGAGDRFGGIGRNGARKTPEAQDARLLDVGARYAFRPGEISNLNADDVILNHSDIRRHEVAYAILSATATTD